MVAFGDISDAAIKAINASALVINGDAEVVRADHPHLGAVFADAAECCRKAVDFAAHERAKVVPVVHRGMRKKLLLLKMRVCTHAPAKVSEVVNPF